MTSDENNRELNEFFYELATGLALPTTIPAIFDRGFGCCAAHRERQGRKHDEWEK